jgi:hypothetical protein
MSSILADAQSWPEAGVAGISLQEREHMRSIKLPNEWRGKPIDKRYYPRKPTVNVRQWYSDHAAKLRSLEKAEGL